MEEHNSIVFFLGAGFSSALGMPGTKELRRLFDRHHPREIKEAVGLVEGSLGKIYEYEGYDIEKLYTLVNDLILLGEGVMPIEISENPEHADLLGRIVKRDAALHGALVAIRDYIMRLLEEEFWDRQLVALESVKQIIQDRILKSIPPANISIHTTNYDVAVERFFKKYHPDISLERAIRKGVYTPEQYMNPDPHSITLCKLHGSIDLYATKGGEIIHHDGPPRSYEGPSELKSMHLYAPIENRVELEKIEKPLVQRLSRDLMFASLIVVVGFSFRDPVIRGLFTNRSSRSRRMVVACGERTKDLLMRTFDDPGSTLGREIHIVSTRFPSRELERGIEKRFTEVVEGGSQ